MIVLWVMLACALGGMARYLVGSVCGRLLPGPLPAGTLVVNLSGALLAGLLAGLAGGTAFAALAGPALWQPLVIGFLGSYTTVSAFSLQVMQLCQQGRRELALVYMLLSVVLCPVMVLAGMLAVSGIGA